jgi:hypothetical protein
VFHGLPERDATLDSAPVPHTSERGTLVVHVPDDRQGHTLVI